MNRADVYIVLANALIEHGLPDVRDSAALLIAALEDGDLKRALSMLSPSEVLLIAAVAEAGINAAE